MGRRTFVPGHKYFRWDLHNYFGGQHQGGISTPPQHSIIFLFSNTQERGFECISPGKAGPVYHYIGEGETGDMTLSRGNLSVVSHVRRKKDLHLFEEIGYGWVRYIGQMVCLGHEWWRGVDLLGRTRKVVVFKLAEIGALSRKEISSEEDPKKLLGVS